MRREAIPHLRCAIYTRVSTEHGLEQEFNSLDNQREAAEAYIKSQAHEGWQCLSTRYDDGGFSGGSMERPALQNLLLAIQARRIDVVVVYKVDRLTRSLTDFAKLVELFDAHAVSFVSVTQAFNTTTSMGRLTLNVLLSFAQFEREVTGERIRDKIGASKKKGIWMGGVVPLGYRVENRALHIVEEHAALVRKLFADYLQRGAVSALSKQLHQNDILVPERIDGAGRRCGGKPFSRGHLYKILSNPIYVGRLSHKGHVHDGQHPAIVDQTTWDGVQARLASNLQGHRRARLASEHLLIGRIRDDRGHAMTPTHAQKGSRRYRYYVSQAVLQGRARGAISRVPAHEIEVLVLEALRGRGRADGDLTDRDLVANYLRQVTIHKDRIEITLDEESEGAIEILWTPSSGRRRCEILGADDVEQQQRAMKCEDRSRILNAIATGQSWLGELTGGRVASIEAIAMREDCSDRSVQRALSLAFLSPRIIEAIIHGKLPRGIGIASLASLPACFAKQHAGLGI